MKKVTGVVLALILSFILFVPVTPANAYEGGVFNGKQISYGTGYTIDGVTSLVTDNDESTVLKLDPGKQLWFEFKTPVQMIAYQLKITSGDSTKVGMGYTCYSGGAYSYFTPPLNTTGTKTYGNSYNDVHRFELINSGDSPIYIAEFDLFIKGEYYELTPPTNLVGTPANASAKLSWDKISHATLYNIYRSLVSGGPYSLLSSTTATSFTDSPLENGTKYYYVVTAVDQYGESDFSNEVSIVPSDKVTDPEPIGDRAILTVTMTTGLEKEFDLSMSEVEAFINWYDAKENGTGPAKYGINRHNNNKGPFSKRVDYVIFKNILSFEVNEYSTVTSATYLH